MLAAREVGQQFEAFFIQMMLKSMRDAGEGLKRPWGQVLAIAMRRCLMLNSSSLAKSQGIGITDWLVQRTRGSRNSTQRHGVSAYQSLASVR